MSILWVEIDLAHSSSSSSSKCKCKCPCPWTRNCVIDYGSPGAMIR